MRLSDAQRKRALEKAVADLLTGITRSSEWAEDPNFKDTPKRVAKMYLEMLTPPPNNWTTFPAQNADLVLLRGHRVFAFCPHHLLPVEMLAYVAYIPHKQTLGLSKLARVVEQHLTRPVMQEDLAHEIADALQSKLDPRGVAVILSGIHGCMRCRGVKSSADVVSSVMKGVFRDVPAARAELMQLIGRP